MSDDDRPDREAILGRRRALVALALSGVAVGPASRAARAQPRPCLGPPRPPDYRAAMTFEVSGDRLRLEDRDEIARSLRGLQPIDVWLEAHILPSANPEQRRAADARALVVQRELVRQGVPASRISRHFDPPPASAEVTVGPRPRFRPRGVSIWYRF